MRYTVILLLLFSGFLASAQKMKVPKYREIIVISPETTIKCQVKLKKEKLINVSEKFTYSWYSNNKIQSTQGGYDGALLDGSYKEYDNADHLLVQGEYKKGLKSGEWKSWYINGKLKEISHWCKGKIYDQKTFDEEGNTIGHYKYSSKGKEDVIASDIARQKKKEEYISKCKQKCEDRKKAKKEEKKKLKEEKAGEEEQKKALDSKSVK